MAQEVITRDGEVIERMTPDASNLSTLVRAEIDTAIATARQYPRRMKVVIDNITTLATLNEATAAECIYALNRGGKAIRGPSIRMAEIIAQTWGNCRVDARVVSIDRTNKVIVAEAMFHDLETNSMTKSSVQRRISDKHGRLYNDDLIVMTGNAACSIARRNAILAGVPKGIWGQGLQAAEQIVRGDAKTLVERRDAAVAAFAHFGATPAQVFQLLGVKGMDDIGLDELVTLRATYSSIKDGQVTVEEALNIARGTPAADHKKIANPLADDPPVEKEASEAPDPKTQRGAPAEDAAAPADGRSKSKTSDPEPASIPEPIAVAQKLGAAARKKGLLRKDMPADYREDGRKAEADAWLSGYDAATPDQK